MVASVYEIKASSEAVMKYMPVTNKVIVLDAGHGGIDSGTLNNDKTIYEKEVLKTEVENYRIERENLLNK